MLDFLSHRRAPRAAVVLAAATCCACSANRLAPIRVQESAQPLAQSVAQSVDPDAGYEPDFHVANGPVLSVRHYHSWLAGDFDGDTTLAGPDTIFIPDADDGSGYSIAAGVMNEGTAYLVSYRRIDYEGEIGSFDADVEYTAFAFEILNFFRANEPVQPYLQLEFLVPLADLEDASTDGVVVGDAKLRPGFGMGLGAGVGWWLSHHLLLDVRAEGAYQWFSKAEGVADDSEDIDGDLDGTNYGISVGLSWAFGGR